jgi:hypothetical protein|tara:strand:- start:71 stop:766 length:696 start_codon:yes stop_codon:yes gene_type:complete
MSAYQRLRWKRVLNDCKHATEELELVQGLNREAAPMFQEYYEAFLAEHEIDLDELNRQHADRIREAYDIPESTEIDGSVPLEIDDSSLIVDVEKRDKTEQEQLSEDDIVLHGIFAKLFKKIALKVHPDKLDPLKHSYNERRQMEQDFRDANRALDNKEYFVLIEIAERLDIALPTNYTQQIRWMNQQLDTVNRELMRQKLTYSYLFAEKQTKQEKDLLIRQFVQQLFGLNL